MCKERIEELLERIEDLEEENYRLQEQLSRQRIQAARAHLGDTIQKYAYDMTGQDGEDEINSAAEDYTRAQDEELRIRDPESYAEKRHMGLL